jgi:Ca-activated chloride channel homolog
MVMPLPYRSLSTPSSAPLAGPPALPSSGAELVTVDGRSLPLIGVRLAAEAGGGLARCVLEQRFENRYDETLRVRYRMPLPADGAVSAYEFELAGRVIAGRVQRKAEAREQFEQAIAAGQTAALLEQERDDIFTQELGNILPGETIVARLTIDQRLVWLAGTSRLGDRPAEGEWELRFPTVIGPRYVGSHDTEDDAQETHVAVAPGQVGARIWIEVAIRDALVPGRRPASPSHEIRARSGRVALHTRQGAPLDRDIVVRWPVAMPEVGVSLDAARGEAGDAYGLLTIVPPAPAALARSVPRDLTVLLDTSGSMGGPPLETAKRVVSLIIESLGEADRLELIEFSDRPRRYRTDPVAATEAERRAAVAWVSSREAGGGTEMASGVREALRALRPGAQRQVVVVTDGYVGGERQIVELLRGLPRGCRLHVLGVGSAVNRSLAAALARAGRGVEVIAGLGPGVPGPGRGGDDAERAAARLIAHTRAPALVDLELSGSALIEQAPAQVPDVFAGAPVVAALALRPEGGELVVRGAVAGGDWERRLRVPALRAGEGSGAIAKLFARERVADLEARATVGELSGGVDEQIEALGLRFQIATRLTSWVAIDELRRAEGRPGRTEDVPQELPYGTSAASFGLRGGEAVAVFGGMDAMAAVVVPSASYGMDKARPRRSASELKQRLGLKKGSSAPNPSAGYPPAAGPAQPSQPSSNVDPSMLRLSMERASTHRTRSPLQRLLVLFFYLLLLGGIAALLWWLVL